MRHQDIINKKPSCPLDDSIRTSHLDDMSKKNGNGQKRYIFKMLLKGQSCFIKLAIKNHRIKEQDQFFSLDVNPLNSEEPSASSFTQSPDLAVMNHAASRLWTSNFLNYQPYSTSAPSQQNAQDDASSNQYPIDLMKINKNIIISDSNGVFSDEKEGFAIFVPKGKNGISILQEIAYVDIGNPLFKRLLASLLTLDQSALQKKEPQIALIDERNYENSKPFCDVGRMVTSVGEKGSLEITLAWERIGDAGDHYFYLNLDRVPELLSDRHPIPKSAVSLIFSEYTKRGEGFIWRDAQGNIQKVVDLIPQSKYPNKFALHNIANEPFRKKLDEALKEVLDQQASSFPSAEQPENGAPKQLSLNLFPSK